MSDIGKTIRGVKEIANMPTSPSRLPRTHRPASSLSRIPRSLDSAKMATCRTPKTSHGDVSEFPSPPTTPWPSSGVSVPDERPRLGSESQAKREAPDEPQSRQSMGDSGPLHVGLAHMGDPCTMDALDHRLNCGHKVITKQPEPCASNCHSPESTSANPRGLDEPFVCFACITKNLQQKHAEKIVSFRSELEQVSKGTKKPYAHEWIRSKLEIIEIAWRDQEVDDMMKQSSLGRFCHAIYVDTDYQELANKAMEKRERLSGLMKTKPEPATPISTLKRTSESQQSQKVLRKGSRLPRKSPPSSPSHPSSLNV